VIAGRGWQLDVVDLAKATAEGRASFSLGEPQERGIAILLSVLFTSVTISSTDAVSHDPVGSLGGLHQAGPRRGGCNHVKGEALQRVSTLATSEAPLLGDDVRSGLRPFSEDSTLGRMTIGIGVICKSGKAAVVAADRMVTYADIGSQMEGDIAKFFRVSRHSVVAAAGSLPDIAYVLNRLRDLPGGPLDALPIGQIATKVKESRDALRSEQIEALYLRRTLGLSMAEFQRIATTQAATPIVTDIFNRILQHRLTLDRGRGQLPLLQGGRSDREPWPAAGATAF
jgi:hypothetical protein